MGVSGCAGKSATGAELRLQREDLVAVCGVLKGIEGAVGREVAATKRAWPLVANGLPAKGSTGAELASARMAIAAAAESAAKIKTPPLLEEAQVVSLTGPGAGLAGLVRTYSGLTVHSWQLINATIEEIEHGSAESARFARENVALYIESVYDGHFDLAQISKKLLAGYRKLGGPSAFGGALTQREVDALAGTYSEATDRLHPHDGVRLGS